MNYKLATTLLLKKLLILKEMKLSNKILIAFAASLILIPVLGMIIVSATQYKTGTHADLVRQIENFSTPTKNMVSVPISKSFDSINIADGKKITFRINLIKDDKFGIKIPNSLKDQISIHPDANGQLQIEVRASPNDENQYANIYIYCPNVKGISVVNAAINLTVKQDSININLKKTSSFYFEDTQLNKATINATNCETVNLREDNIKSLTLKLINTNFSTELISYDFLSISTSGKSEIYITGSREKSSNYSIKNLILNTVDQAEVKLENIKVNNCSGKLSDETQVQMPAINLNQMYKK